MSILTLPLVWSPLVLGCLAATWVLSALGVFIRDIGQFIGVGVNILLFTSAVFYPVDSLPTRLQPYAAMNPIIQVIDQTREICISGNGPSIAYLILSSTFGLIMCELSFRFHQKARRGFADVL